MQRSVGSSEASDHDITSSITLDLDLDQDQDQDQFQHKEPWDSVVEKLHTNLSHSKYPSVQASAHHTLPSQAIPSLALRGHPFSLCTPHINASHEPHGLHRDLHCPFFLYRGNSEFCEPESCRLTNIGLLRLFAR